jgi:hypothetical protein
MREAISRIRLIGPSVSRSVMDRGFVSVLMTSFARRRFRSLNGCLMTTFDGLLPSLSLIRTDYDDLPCLYRTLFAGTY